MKKTLWAALCLILVQSSAHAQVTSKIRYHISPEPLEAGTYHDLSQEFNQILSVLNGISKNIDSACVSAILSHMDQIAARYNRLSELISDSRLKENMDEQDLSEKMELLKKIECKIFAVSNVKITAHKNIKPTPQYSTKDPFPAFMQSQARLMTGIQKMMSKNPNKTVHNFTDVCNLFAFQN